MESAVRSVVFADVCDSSRLFEQRGDVAAREAIRGLLERCSVVVCEHGGVVVKTIGDEIMAAFHKPQEALAAACVLLREVNDAGVSDAVGLRIGLHHGEVLQEDSDLYGSTVNTAARMVAMARCGQLIASAESLSSVSLDALALVGFSLGDHRLPGLSDPIEVMELIWRRSDASTSISTRPSLVGRATDSSLELRRGDLQLQLSAGCEPVQLGRDAAADVVVDAHWVSRLHAVIEYRRGFFLLRDMSTNGTFVSLKDGDTVVLHRNELTLRGQGRISLGREPARDPGPALHFSCR